MTTNTLAKLASECWSAAQLAPNEGIEDGIARIEALLAENAWTEYTAPAQIEAIAHRMCWRYKHSSDPAHSDTYKFNRVTLLEFARKLMQGETK